MRINFIKPNKNGYLKKNKYPNKTKNPKTFIGRVENISKAMARLTCIQAGFYMSTEPRIYLCQLSSWKAR